MQTDVDLKVAYSELPDHIRSSLIDFMLPKDSRLEDLSDWMMSVITGPGNSRIKN